MKYSIISKHRTLLMGAAAIWIYIFHLMPAPAYASIAPWQIPVWFIQVAGFCGVDMFLFLSGFGLAYYLKKHPVDSLREYGSFISRRFSRIYQVYLPFTLIFGLLADWTLRTFLRRLFIVDQLTTNVYAFGWYVACILVFYLLTPAYMAAYRRAEGHRLSLTVVLSAVLIYAFYKLQGSIRSDLYAILVRIPVFLLGILTADYAMEERKISPIGWAVGLSMLVGGVTLSYLLHSGQAVWIMPAVNALVNVFLAPGLILVLAAVFEWIGNFRPLQWLLKIIAFYGGISFELYLMQEWYVARGVQILPATRMLRQVEILGIMTLASWLLQKLGKLLFGREKR